MPSESYCEVSSGSLPDVLPLLPTEPGEKTDDAVAVVAFVGVVEDGELLVRMRKRGRFRWLLVLFASILLFCLLTL